MATLNPDPDWTSVVARHARSAGVALSSQTIDELATHLEDIYLAARADGDDDEAARLKALRALETSGFVPLRREPRPDARATYARLADDAAAASRSRSFAMGYALRMALRQFRLQPAFAAIVVLVLGLGTGAATAVYTIVDSVVLRPLPYRAPDRLVKLWDTNTEKGLAHDPFSPVTFMDYRALPVFEDAAAWWRPDLNLRDPGLDPVRVKAIETSANLFQVLGTGTQLGEGFPKDGPFFSRTRIAVISDRLWRTRYGADPSVVGRVLQLDDTPYTVVGIMPAGFHFPDDVDVWQRLQWDLTQHSRSAHFMEGVARLKDGVSIEQARAAADTLAARLGQQFEGSNKGWAIAVTPLLHDQLGYYRPALYVLFGAVGLLFVIGCLNVASLLLTRALGREREIAVRTAIGAAPRHIVVQLLAESVILSAAGAIVGLLVALVAIPVVVAVTPVTIPRLDEAAVSLRVLGLALGAGRRHDDDVRPGPIPGPGPPARGQRSQGRRPRQLAGPAGAAPGPRHRRGRAGLRARRRLGAARADRGRDDAHAAGRGTEERGPRRRAAVGRIHEWRLAGRRRRARDHPRADPPAARRSVGRQHEHPPDGARLAEPVPAGRSDVRPPRRPAAGAVPLGQRRLLRDDGRDARRWTGVHRARHPRRRGRRHRQPDAGTPVLSGTLGGRPRDRVDAGAGRSAGAQPDVDDPARRPAPAAGAHAHRRRGRRHPGRAARHSCRACRLRAHAAVPVRQRHDRHRRARSRDGRRRPSAAR